MTEIKKVSKTFTLREEEQLREGLSILFMKTCDELKKKEGIVERKKIIKKAKEVQDLMAKCQMKKGKK